MVLSIIKTLTKPVLENKLSQILKQKNVTYKELAFSTGLDTTHISRIINKKDDIRLTTAFRIAEALGVPIEEIFMVTKVK